MYVLREAIMAFTGVNAAVSIALVACFSPNRLRLIISSGLETRPYTRHMASRHDCM
jgi:hypothetical protein